MLDQLDKQLKRAELGNRLTVVGMELPHLHSVNLAVMTRGGLYYDGAENWAVSHVLEHLVLRGNAEHPNPQAHVYTLGDDYNGAVAQDFIEFSANVHPDHVGDALELYASLIRDPDLSDESIETEKRIIMHEIRERATDRDELIMDIVARETFPHLDQGYESDPDLDHFDRITADDIRARHEKYFCGANTVIALAGAFDFDQVLATIDESFGRLPEGEPLDYSTGSLNSELPLLALVGSPYDPAELVLTYSGQEREVPWPLLTLIDDYLIGAPDSVLFQRVRQELGLCYRLYSSMEYFKSFHRYSLVFEFEPSNLRQIHDEVAQAVGRLVSDGLDEETLAKLVAMREKSTDMLLDDPRFIRSLMGRDTLDTGKIDLPWRNLAEIKKVPPGQIREAAGILFDSRSLHVLVCGPFTGREFREARAFLEEAYPGISVTAPSRYFLKRTWRDFLPHRRDRQD